MGADAYKWETKKRTWDHLQIGENGGLQLRDDVVLENQRRKRMRALDKVHVPENIRRGVIRFLCIIVDLTASVARRDVRPNRLIVMHAALERFVREFFDQNPLSNLTILAMRTETASELSSGHPVATVLSEMSSNMKDHLRAVGNLQTEVPSGIPSLQQGLRLALSGLRNKPNYGVREVIVLASSLCTNDPDNLLHTVKEAKKLGVKCSVIGLGGEVHIYRHLAESTGGMYRVALDGVHYSTLLSALREPPALKKKMALGLAPPMEVGFPKKAEALGVLMSTSSAVSLEFGGFECPRCKSRVSGNLPQMCHVCGLHLLSSAHLSRTAHHLFPVPRFIEVTDDSAANYRHCYCCEIPFKDGRDIKYRCPRCANVFSAECDLYIHEHLHNCPGCQS